MAAAKKTTKTVSKSLDNDEDVENSLENSKGEKSDGHYLRLKEGKHALYFLSPDYAEGYVHWLNFPEGARKIVCGGGVDGRGWAEDACPICKQTAELFRKAKKHEESHGKDNAVSNKLRKRARAIRAKYEAAFLVAAGTLIRVKKGEEKVWEPDFDDGKVGILTLSRQQYEDFTSLRGSEAHPFMKSGADLTNRVIVLDKAKRDGEAFATSVFHPSKKPSDPPMEYDADEFDLDAEYLIDEEEIEKAGILLTSPEVDDDADFEDEEDEEKPTPKKGKSKSAKEAEDDFLNEEDSDDDDDDSEDDDSDEDSDSDDDFEDDDVEEEEKPTPKAKKPAAKASASKKPVAKKPTTRKGK